MAAILLTGLVLFFVYSVTGFCVYLIASKWTDRELTRREAVMSGLMVGVTIAVTSFLGAYGLALTLFLMASLLVKIYDCKVVNSILMTIATLLIPVLLDKGVGWLLMLL